VAAILPIAWRSGRHRRARRVDVSCTRRHNHPHDVAPRRPPARRHHHHSI